MQKRLWILSGHYGSGKTNLAVNLAFDWRRQFEKVAIADLDIVNPYFRSKDSESYFQAAGIRFICSAYANSNVDIPALPQDIYAITDDRSYHCVLDIGGDDRGAMVLGRIAPAILAENDYESVFVFNKYRPLTSDIPSTIAVLREIESACGISFTGLINNSNLGEETTAETILQALPFADKLAAATGLPILYTSVKQTLADVLQGNIPQLYPLHLQKKF